MRSWLCTQTKQCLDGCYPSLTLQEDSCAGAFSLQSVTSHIQDKTRKSNNQDDELSRLRTSAASTAEDEEELKAFKIQEDKTKNQDTIFLSIDTVHMDAFDQTDDLDPNDLDYLPADALFETLPGPTPSEPIFQQISTA